jgi:hypothetical protein
MSKTDTDNTNQTIKHKNDQKQLPSNATIKRARQVMKLGHAEDEELYAAELAKLLDKFGMDFVCDYACQEAAHGRKACSKGHCAKPYEHTGVEDMTCGEMIFSYVNVFVGYRSKEDADAAATSRYAYVPVQKRD